MFKTILIGFGNIASGYANDTVMNRFFEYSTHIQVLKNHPNFDLKTVVDKDEKLIQEAKNIWGIEEVTDDINKIENPSEFEIAVIAIPPKGRFAIIKKLTNLKAIILEKPIAENINEAKKIIEICKKRNILVQVNFLRRFDEKILLNLRNFHQHVGDLQAAFGLYGNGLKNNGSHLIDWARMFLGEVIWVQTIADGKSLNEGPLNNDLNVPFLLGFKNDNILMVQKLEFKFYREILLDFWGEKGRLLFTQEGLISSNLRTTKHRYSRNDFEISSDQHDFKLMGQSDAMYNMFSNLSEAIFSNVALRSDLNNAFIVMKIINNIEKSFSKNDEKIFIND